MLKKSYALLTGLYLCALLSGIFPQKIISFTVCVILFFLMFTSEFFLAFPVMIFYYSVFGVLFGVSVYRIFSLLLLLKFIIDSKGIIRKSTAVYPIVVFSLFCLFVFSNYNLKAALFTIVSVLCVVIVVNYYLDTSESVKRFFTMYVIAALCSYITGLITGNTMSYSERLLSGVSLLNRFMATFEDPNYMGFFFTVAVFATVTLQLFNKKVRVIVVIVLYLMILTTLSMTAVLGNILLWMVYLFFAKKISIKTTGVLLLMLIAFCIAFNLGVFNTGTPVFGAVFARVQDKLLAFKSGNMNSATTGRMNHISEHLNYFWNQSVFRILIGGNMVNPFGVYASGLEQSVAHNEYVDMLLNVGVIGSAVLLWYMAVTTYKHIKAYHSTESNVALCKMMMKFIWIYYACTLSLFLDFRFMLTYFI